MQVNDLGGLGAVGEAAHVPRDLLAVAQVQRLERRAGDLHRQVPAGLLVAVQEQLLHTPGETKKKNTHTHEIKKQSQEIKQSRDSSVAELFS